MHEPLFIFNTEFVFVTKAREHEKIKRDLQPIIERNLPLTEGGQSGTWLCDVNTEFFSMTKKDSKYSALIHGELFRAVQNAFDANQVFFKPKKAEVVDIWYNHYRNGGTQEVHSHGSKGYTLSGVYVLETKEPSPLVFFSSAAANTPFINPTYRPDLVEGDIVLFTSQLPHYVLPCKHSRTTVAFNVRCEF